MRTPTQCAGWLTIAAIVLGVVAGVFTLVFIFRTGHCFATLVTLAMTVFWGAVAAVLVVSATGARRVQAEMRKQAVDRVLKHLVSDLDATSDKDAEKRAELVDRIHALASMALGKP